MASNCIDTTLNRSGSSRLQRVMQALLPHNAKVDERDYADLLLFAKKYAAYLQYYNELDVVDGDWQALMKMDVSVTLAAIAKTDVPAYKNYVQVVYNRVKAAPNETELKQHFKNVFDLVFSTMKELDDYYRDIPADFEFKEYFFSTIQARLQEPLFRINAYYNQFVTAGYIDNAGTHLPADAPLPMLLAQNFTIGQLSPVFTNSTPVPVLQLSLPTPADVSNSIYHITTHNLFNAQLETLFKTLGNVVSQSATFLEQTLTNFPSHTPHFALYITFLKLFRNAQNELNLFAGRHLDFYYKDVLQLKTKDAIPDSVHLLVELQKGIEQHRIAAGTLFKGGKDADGIEINYAADNDTVISRAAVKSLQNLLVLPGIVPGKSFETVFAGTMANSADGMGAPITSAGGDWYPFGDAGKMAEANMGFLIASHYLYLNEGSRTITVTCSFQQSFTLNATELSTAFSLQLTGKKGWHNVANYSASVNSSARTVTLSFTLDGDAPAIVGYAKKVHQDNYNTTLPLLRCMLVITKGTSNPYLTLRQLTLTNIALTVSVEGVKDVVIQNDEGQVDPAKPFLPFGSQPKVGSSFIVGSKEIFQKKLSALSVVIDWDDVPESLADELDEALHEYELTLSYINVKRKFHTVKTQVLLKGKWTDLDSQKGIFIEDNLYNVIYNWTRPEYKYARKLSPSDIEHAVVNISTVNIQPNSQNFDKNEAYSHKSVDGFVRLNLNSPDFGHSAYPAALRNAAQTVTVKITDSGNTKTMSVEPTSALPKEPYTPKAKSFSVNYTATTNIQLANAASADFEGKQNFFYHVTPFGYARANAVLQGSATLLPAYTNQGELYIGFENLLPSTTLKVLFQVADGTSNPLKVENDVQWWYLANNQWKVFEDLDLVDDTKNFTQSGIVTFILGDDIATGNTAFDPTLSWIKASVQKDTDAVCRLVDIHAQALKATLQSIPEKNIWFKQLLPANTISKLLIADAAVKKISQPYSSFGGRVPETSEQFYTRVSERLRHNQRAVAAWDYEHLVLEQFPSVYKTKCIQHTGLIPANIPGTTRYSETAPGHVTVVTIPDLHNNSFNNPLKPYTSIGLLTNIKDFLATMTTPFVKLHVLNPKFEEVQFQFEVKILAPFDETFYVKQLSLDIEQFLCPWAFDLGGDIEFGGKISKSVVLNFIEERPYVDYVLCFKMHHYVDRGTATAKSFYDVEDAVTTTGISILVSYYDEITQTRHLVNAGEPCTC